MFKCEELCEVIFSPTRASLFFASRNQNRIIITIIVRSMKIPSSIVVFLLPWTIVPVASKDDDHPQPDRCLIMEMYADDPFSCEGKPTKTVGLPCLSGPGMPCSYDEKVPNISVKDWYCDDTGFHETGYQGTESCDEEKGRKFPVDVPFQKCFGGIKLTECRVGDCNGAVETYVLEEHQLAEIAFLGMDNEMQSMTTK